jgi:hypothetical protein
MNMIVAIDFTASNGSPKQPTSLHYFNPTVPNQYQAAILAIGEILMNYDSDKRIPAFGFGGKVKGQTSHCFALSGNAQEIEALGVQHLIAMYKSALSSIELSGPTYFG